MCVVQVHRCRTAHWRIWRGCWRPRTSRRAAALRGETFSASSATTAVVLRPTPRTGRCGSAQGWGGSYLAGDTAGDQRVHMVLHVPLAQDYCPPHTASSDGLYQTHPLDPRGLVAAKLEGDLGRMQNRTPLVTPSYVVKQGELQVRYSSSWQGNAGLGNGPSLYSHSVRVALP